MTNAGQSELWKKCCTLVGGLATMYYTKVVIIRPNPGLSSINRLLGMMTVERYELKNFMTDIFHHEEACCIWLFVLRTSTSRHLRLPVGSSLHANNKTQTCKCEEGSCVKDRANGVQGSELFVHFVHGIRRLDNISAKPDMSCSWNNRLRWLRHIPFPLPSPICVFQIQHCSPKAQRQASSILEAQGRPRSTGPVDPPQKLASVAQPEAKRSKMDGNRDGWEEGPM